MEAIEKPAYGATCNGCGECCKDQICPFGAKIFGTSKGPCPALIPDEDGKYTCGCVEYPDEIKPFQASIHGVERLRKAALFLIGAGYGCDACKVGELKSKYHSDRFRKLSCQVDHRADGHLKVWGL